MIEKKLTRIEVKDSRGTGISIELFLPRDEMLIGSYVRELATIWQESYSGNPESVFINGQPYPLDGLTQNPKSPRRNGASLPPMDDLLLYEGAGSWWTPLMFTGWMHDLAGKVICDRVIKKMIRVKKYLQIRDRHAP